MNSIFRTLATTKLLKWSHCCHVSWQLAKQLSHASASSFAISLAMSCLLNLVSEHNALSFVLLGVNVDVTTVPICLDVLSMKTTTMPMFFSINAQHWAKNFVDVTGGVSFQTDEQLAGARVLHCWCTSTKESNELFPCGPHRKDRTCSFAQFAPFQ